MIQTEEQLSKNIEVLSSRINRLPKYSEERKRLLVAKSNYRKALDRLQGKEVKDGRGTLCH